MEITIFGMKFRLEILILIAVVYWILVGHVCCSCYRGGMMEGLTNAPLSGQNKRIRDWIFEKLNVEGFTGANTNYGQSAPYSLANKKPVDASKWGMPDLTYQKGKPMNKAVQDFLNRPKQPIPLPEGEMLMFANTEFKGECCPSSFSNSMGCACITLPQYNYLISRGGNNVPYSEY